MTKLDLDNNGHAMLLQGMWARMERDGDIDAGFMSDSHILTRFFEIYRPPTQCFFDMDEDGIYFAVWFAPFLSSMWQGLWVREDKRKSPGVFKSWIGVLNDVLEHIPVIIGITKRPELLEPHKKLGYDISMAIPEIYEGKTGWLVQLHRSRFKYLKTGDSSNGRQTSTSNVGTAT